MINTKVLKMLKSIDPDSYVQYCETGINNKGERRVNQEDIRLFIQKVYGTDIDILSSI